MTDATAYMKWFYRGILASFTVSVAYVVVQPEYNFAHWIPHPLLRGLGVPYDALLYFESNADKLLHPLIAFILVLLLAKAEIPRISEPPHRPLQILLLTMLSAEIVQWKIGRGFEAADLALGLLGALCAYLIIYRQRRAITHSGKDR